MDNLDSESDFLKPGRPLLIGLFVLFLFFLMACTAAEEPPQATATFPPAPTLAPTAGSESSPVPLAQAEPSTPNSYPPPETAAAAESENAYPPPESSSSPGPEIDNSQTLTETVLLPLVGTESEPTPTPEPDLPPPPTAIPTPTPIPTLDFAAIQQDLQNQGQRMATDKIGFHVAVGGSKEGLSTWINRLDEAGVPIFLKSVGDAGPLFEAQNLSKASGVPHVLVYRFAGNEYDTPNYDLPPAQAAAEHWALHMTVWPPELDPSMVWLETINEVDKEKSEWLGQFALETAKLAERDGFKWAAFGWSSGEPEVENWQSPSMMEFLRLAGNNPDRLAIALHEYSYIKTEIGHQYPFKLGRFQQLFQLCDVIGIPRPTVLITEWGWEYQNIPDVGQAMADIDWGNRLYAQFPEVKGAAIWYLGPGYGSIDQQTQKLIEPVMIEALTTYQAVPVGPVPIAPDTLKP